MIKVISAIIWISLAVLCASAQSQDDSINRLLSNGDELLEYALNITKNETDKESVLQEALKSYDQAIQGSTRSAMIVSFGTKKHSNHMIRPSRAIIGLHWLGIRKVKLSSS